LSFAVFALGGADPNVGFYLRILRFDRPMIIVRPIWDTIVVSCAIVASAMCEESVRHVNMGLLPLIVPCKGPPLYLLGCDIEGL
jgi:hypothetical protein